MNATGFVHKLSHQWWPVVAHWLVLKPLWWHVVGMVLMGVLYCMATFPLLGNELEELVLYPGIIIGMCVYVTVLAMAIVNRLEYYMGVLVAIEHQWYKFCARYVLGFAAFAWLFFLVFWHVEHHNIIIVYNTSLIILGFVLMFPGVDQTIVYALYLASILQRWQQQEGHKQPSLKLKQRRPLAFMELLHHLPTMLEQERRRKAQA